MVCSDLSHELVLWEGIKVVDDDFDGGWWCSSFMGWLRHLQLKCLFPARKSCLWNYLWVFLRKGGERKSEGVWERELQVGRRWEEVDLEHAHNIVTSQFPTMQQPSGNGTRCGPIKHKRDNSYTIYTHINVRTCVLNCSLPNKRVAKGSDLPSAFAAKSLQT